MKKNDKLYNIILPVWLIWMFPPLLFACLILNTIIDYVVVFFSMKKLGIEDAKKKTMKALFKVVVFGFLADFVGAGLLAAASYIFAETNTIEHIFMNPFNSVASFLTVAIAIVVAALLIYILNYKLSFTKIEINDKQKKKIALYLAIFTAPYTFLIPTVWLMSSM